MSDTPPSTLTVTRAVESETVRLPLRFDDWRLFSSVFVFGIVVPIPLLVLLGFFADAGMAVVGAVILAPLFSVVLAVVASVLFHKTKLRSYHVRASRSDTWSLAIGGGFYCSIFSLGLGVSIVNGFEVVTPILWWSGALLIGVGGPVFIVMLGLLWSGRRGEVTVDGAWVRVHGRRRNRHRWAIGSVTMVESYTDGDVKVNNESIKALEGLYKSERMWLVRWLREHLRVRVEDVGAAPEPGGSGAVPDELEALRGSSAPGAEDG